jgi:beta-glucanase (GH16 family)
VGLTARQQQIVTSPPYRAAVPHTHELAVVPPPDERPPSSAGAIVLTLVLSTVAGLAISLVVLIGFWPAPAADTTAARATTAPAPAGIATAGPQRTIRQSVLDPAVPTDTEAAKQWGWQQIGGDEFTGTTLDQTYWRPYSDLNGTTQRAVENLAVSDGTLKVISAGTTTAGMGWEPGQLYGRWEVRARTEPGTGYRPALLLWPDAEDWPAGGELDFLDTPDPDRTQTNFVVHFGEDNNQDITTTTGDFTQWHNYAIEWAPDHIAGFIDGQEVFRTEDPEKIPTRPMHLAIQQDVGPSEDGWTPARDATTPARVQMEVDWVRIYGP